MEIDSHLHKLNYKQLFDESPGIYLILAPDEKFTILGTNKARDIATMRNREDVIGKGVFEAFPDNPDDPNATGEANLSASLKRVVKNKIPDRMPFQKYDIRRPADQGGGFEERYWSPLNIPVLNSSGEIEVIIHQVDDVTELILSQNETTSQLAFNKELEKEIDERKKAEAALQESKNRFEAIFNNSLDGIILKHANGDIELANPAALSIMKCDNIECMNSLFQENFNDKNLAYKNFMMKRDETGKARGELEIKRADDQIIPFEVSSTLFTDEMGEVWSTVFFREITERKIIEMEQNRWLQIAEMTPDFTSRIKPNGQLVYLNHTWRKFLQVNEADVLTMTLADIHSESSLALLLREGIPKAIKRDKWIGEATIVNHENKERVVSEVILTHKDKNGEVEYLTIMARDISDRKHKEDAQRFLAEASKALASPLEQLDAYAELAKLIVPQLADFCVIVLKKDGQLCSSTAIHTNPEEQKLLEKIEFCHIERNTAVGIWKVANTGISELVPSVVDAWLSNATTNNDQLESFKKLNTRSLIIVPLLAREKVLGAVLLGSNKPDRQFDQYDLNLAEEIASRAALSANNLTLYQQAQDAIQVRDEVLRIVAHDLRNPLNTISLSAQLLTEKLPEERCKDKKLLQMINKSVALANGLIQDLLDIAKMQAKQLTIDKKLIETKSMLEEIVELNQASFSKKNINFIVELDEYLPPIMADRGRFSQIFSNLLSNALKFTPEEGEIILKTEILKNEIRFIVYDSGPRIPEEQLPFLFKPFWQSKKGTKEGAGLGLSITKALVEAHGGNIWVENGKDMGISFIFTIPIAETDTHEIQNQMTSLH